MGKGSTRRPGKIPDENWERIFGKKDKQQDKQEQKKGKKD